jgi:hypothetical protein
MKPENDLAKFHDGGSFMVLLSDALSKIVTTLYGAVKMNMKTVLI